MGCVFGRLSSMLLYPSRSLPFFVNSCSGSTVIVLSMAKSTNTSRISSSSSKASPPLQYASTSIKGGGSPSSIHRSRRLLPFVEQYTKKGQAIFPEKAAPASLAERATTAAEAAAPSANVIEPCKGVPSTSGVDVADVDTGLCMSYRCEQCAKQDRAAIMILHTEVYKFSNPSDTRRWVVYYCSDFRTDHVKCELLHALDAEGTVDCVRLCFRDPPADDVELGDDNNAHHSGGAVSKQISGTLLLKLRVDLNRSRRRLTTEEEYLPGVVSSAADDSSCSSTYADVLDRRYPETDAPDVGQCLRLPLDSVHVTLSSQNVDRDLSLVKDSSACG